MLAEGFSLERIYPRQGGPHNLLGPHPNSTAGRWRLQTPRGPIVLWRADAIAQGTPDLRRSVWLLSVSGEFFEDDPARFASLVGWLQKEGLSGTEFRTRREAIETICEGMRRSAKSEG